MIGLNQSLFNHKVKNSNLYPLFKDIELVEHLDDVLNYVEIQYNKKGYIETGVEPYYNHSGGYFDNYKVSQPTFFDNLDIDEKLDISHFWIEELVKPC